MQSDVAMHEWEERYPRSSAAKKVKGYKQENLLTIGLIGKGVSSNKPKLFFFIRNP